MSERRVVLREGVGEADVDRLAERRGWMFRGQIEVGEDRPFERIWQTADGLASIHYIEDWVIGLPYVLVDAAAADELAEAIRRELDAWSLADAYALFERARTPDERIEALYHIAVMAPPSFAPESYGFLQRALSDDDSEVRRAAALAAFYTRWPELEPDLERLARDSVPRVAQYAAVVLEKLREHHWPAR